jgi:hypothetical protein
VRAIHPCTQDGFFITGDVGEMRPSGLSVIDRVKNVFKLAQVRARGDVLRDLLRVWCVRTTAPVCVRLGRVCRTPIDRERAGELAACATRAHRRQLAEGVRALRPPTLLIRAHDDVVMCVGSL